MLIDFHQVHLGNNSCGKNPQILLHLNMVPLGNCGARRSVNSLSASKVLSRQSPLLVALEKRVVMPKLKYLNSKNAFWIREPENIIIKIIHNVVDASDLCFCLVVLVFFFLTDTVMFMVSIQESPF